MASTWLPTVISVAFIGEGIWRMVASGEATNAAEKATADKILFYCVVTIRALGFILLYGGIITVITGLYTMTPETANGRGAVPLVGDGKVPGVGAQVPGYEG